jgi:hypothetical protein
MNRTEGISSATALKRAQPEEFDLVILGGGTGSTIAAWTFAGEGKYVSVVDRKYIGGSCPNIACLPSMQVVVFPYRGCSFTTITRVQIPSRTPTI